jgi:ribosomal protein S18 acetylase RimI-like enzyme
VREYDPARDAPGLRACFVELQDFERGLAPGAPAGEAVADAYLARMWSRCARWDGRVFVAETQDGVVGFVCIWARVPPQEPDDEPVEIAYVSDLVVREPHRGRGVGRRLLESAEAYARERGATRLGVGVLARNRDALGLYRSLGFADHHLEMVKRLCDRV